MKPMRDLWLGLFLLSLMAADRYVLHIHLSGYELFLGGLFAGGCLGKFAASSVDQKGS